MLILVAYDVNTTSINGRRRLRDVAKLCEKYGKRVQKSLFECSIDAAQERTFQQRLLDIIDQTKDNLILYHLGNRGFEKVVRFGNASVSYPDVLIY